MSYTVECSWDELFAATEPARHGRAEGEPHPTPEAYDESYTLPPHRVKSLELRYPCERDRHIRFLEEPHIYLVNEVPMEISVTGIVHAYGGSFDAPKIIQGMQAARRQAWPRLKYAFNAARVDALDSPRNSSHLVLIVDTRDADQRTLWTGEAPEVLSEAWVLGRAKAGLSRYRFSDDVEFDQLAIYTYERALEPDEIKVEWARNATQSANMGTEAHLNMELWSNSEPARRCPELRQGLEFVRDQLVPLGIKSFRTEWELWAEDEGFAGSCDWVGQLPSGNLVIVDWKRTSNHEVHSQYNKFLSAPLDHIDDTDVAKFALQLGTYMWTIERYYGHRVEALALCSIHPEHGFFMFVPYLRLEVDFLMAKRRQRMAMRRLISTVHIDEVPRCALSNGVAWDPVRVGDVLCDAKYAAWMRPEDEATPDEHAKNVLATFEKRLASDASVEELALNTAQKWRARVPRDGRRNYVACRSI